MQERIEKIELVKDFKYKGEWFDGYAVKTDMFAYLILIDNAQNCCENWGYLMTEDAPVKFIGAQLREIIRVNEDRSTFKLEHSFDSDEDNAMFINFITDKGLLQFVVYNNHNGYYGHSVLFLKVTGETYEEVISDYL